MCPACGKCGVVDPSDDRWVVDPWLRHEWVLIRTCDLHMQSHTHTHTLMTHVIA